MTNTCPSFIATKNILDDQYSAFVQKNHSTIELRPLSKCREAEWEKIVRFWEIQKNILKFPQ